ncbi:DUF4097 family beta strand repeat-containing protein [Gandjariella thermophila]|nr:DUF4097 family beta strand repeat-containing protein [Gandjariella thermophila]
MTNDDTGNGGAASGEPPREEPAVRLESFQAEGPLDIDITLDAGRVEVRLVEEPGAHVELRHDPSAASPWLAGVTGLLSLFGGQFGMPAEDIPARVLAQATVELVGQRLVVRMPKELPLRGVPIAVTVTAPRGSHPQVRSASADVRVTGPAGRLSVSTGTGEVSADRADDRAEVKSGSGAVRLGPMLGGLHARTGSGEVEVSSIGGRTTLVTGSGDVWLGTVQADVAVRTGTGDVTVADAAAGRIELGTGSGEIRVGVRGGTTAEVDLSSGAGRARSELDVSQQRPDTEPALFIRGRTGSGDAVISAAVG